MTAAELRLQAVLHQQMAALEKALEGQGAGAWETAIITYHPEKEGAYIVVLTDGATVQQAHKLLDDLRGAGL
jgi:hypothetical protein